MDKNLDKIIFCLVFSNQKFTKITSNILLNLGIISITTERPENVPEIMKSKKINFIFLDLDFSGDASFKLLDELKANSEYASIYIVATSFNTNKQFIERLQKYNIISFLTKPLTKENIEKKTNLILNKLKEHFPERKHIRVNPSEDELMRISFKLQNKKNITAKVIDISLGGVAVLLYNNYDGPELSSGKLIEHITFTASNYEIDVDAKVVNKKEKFIAFKFTHFYNNSNKELAKYIMKKLTV